MKYFAPLCVVFACFTAPHGDLGIWIMKEQIVAVEHAVACDPAAHAQIVTASGTVCIRETPQQALKLLESIKDEK